MMPIILVKIGSFFLIKIGDFENRLEENKVFAPRHLTNGRY